MLDPKYIPLFIGGFIAWICFMIFVGWITSRGKNEAHFQLPAFAVRFHSAVQHTVHTAIAQLVVHPQAIVLPAVTTRRFGQGHCLKYGLR